ncbi:MULTISPECIES: hypothetical protein [unclassified Allomuricauda]|uniref:hypothetical protein n=1 Tax=unclassified Allomuricauda TaxID=2615049 RepID=UPI00273F1E9A|nr:MULTISPECIES: hypothetical protein [unclassified Allomuricauda]
MRPTLILIFMAAMFCSCGPLRQLQKSGSQVPVLGSIGQQQSSLFKKEFQKVGEPHLATPISVSLESTPLSGKARARYNRFRERMGRAPLTQTMDTTQLTGLKYYQIEINDAVHLVEALNDALNANLRTYLKENTKLEVISSMYFVVNADLSEKMDETEKLYLTTDQSGALSLKMGNARNGDSIKLSDMYIFDYRTASFCWNKDKRGQLQIAQILFDGGACPGNTKANPEKLNKTPDYLKL